MYNDGTGVQTPPTGKLPDARREKRCESAFALCMTGKGFTKWGAGMGTDLGRVAPLDAGAVVADAGMGMKSPYDASEYKGISFWAKSDMPAALLMRVNFKDKNTAPEGGVCDEAAESGAEACNDDWGKNINLTSEWKPSRSCSARSNRAAGARRSPSSISRTPTRCSSRSTRASTSTCASTTWPSCADFRPSLHSPCEVECVSGAPLR